MTLATRSIIFFCAFLVCMLLLGFAAWPLLLENITLLKSTLIALKKFCQTHMWVGHIAYAGLFSLILLMGLPFATLACLLAGVIYGFWHGVTLAAACRMAVAVLTFWAIRYCLQKQKPCPSRYYMRRRKTSGWLERFSQHPQLGLLLARLSPLPDNVVNCTIAASPIDKKPFVLLSLLGMLPFTAVYVWLGSELGSISRLIRYIQ